jgi:vancomycin resistance protein YoaR
VILDASEQADLARAMLSQPLTLTLPSQDANQAGPWTINPQELAPMLAFERVPDGSSTQYQVRLNREMLQAYLANLAPNLVRTPQNARFTFNDETHQLELLQSAVIGRELNVEGSIEDIQKRLDGGEHSIPLTMKYTDPSVTDKSTGEQLGIRELIHAETSYYYGSSSSRVQNIKTAASKFHGLLVAPGETFSMATALGDITLDNGYAEALIIVGNQTLKGVGGGVCQVSTTLFRTVFFSGFPIVERHAHAYRVYYYEKVAGNRINPNFAGRDATVFVPLVDFKFTNDTPYWLLMETYVNPEASSITWKFYSTSDNRRVEWDTTGPTNIVSAPPAVYHENSDLPGGTIKQVDWAADGADVTVNRTVYRGDAVHLQDTIYTHYEAWPDAFDYGPGTEIPSP